jgi:amidase
MAHTVADLAATLDVIAGFDPEDLWTANSLGKMPMQSYSSFVQADGLRGARVGVLKEAWDFTELADPEVIEMAKQAIAVFGGNGAAVFDSVTLGINLPGYIENNGFPARFERIAAVQSYLDRHDSDYPLQTARALLLDHAGVPERPQDREHLEAPIDLDRDPRYRAALEGKAKLREAIIALMDRFQLDALIYPHKLHGPLVIGPKDDAERGYKPNQMSPVTGLPAFIVPMGFTPNGGLPVGLEILGRPWSEPTLIKLASGFEAVTNNRRVPASTPPLPGESFDF